MIADRKLIN